MPYNIGDHVGDYQILEILGSGGMGRVYKVRSLISDRVEAMKILLPNLESDPELADRFMREVKVQASLQHPNIAALHSAIRIDNQLLMFIEFLEGMTLESELRKGAIAAGLAIKYTTQVLLALQYAHTRGVVHRDIKPANIMVAPDNTVKLMDFGIARVAADRTLTQTGRTVGSLYYMSPEQIQGDAALDGRSDLYSLGVTLYEMVSGRRPFAGDSDFAIMAAHLTWKPVSPSELNFELPKALSDVIIKSIKKDPIERFQSAAEFRKSLLKLEKTVFYPAGQGPARRPKKDPDAASKKQPGEFTRMFQTPAGPPAPRSKPPSPASQAPGPGEFTRMFQAPPGVPAPRAKAPSPPPPAGPGEFTRMFETPAEPPARPPTVQPPPPAPAQEPGEFTRLFQARSAPETKNPSEGTKDSPGLFTATYRADRLVQPPPEGRPAAIDPPPHSPEPAEARTVAARPPTKLVESDAVRAEQNEPSESPADVTGLFFSADSQLPRVHLNVAASAEPTRIGQSFPITAVPFRIGRADCDANFRYDSAISKLHAVINWADGVFTILDVSSNGTYLNGTKLREKHPELLPFGAIIRLSSTTSLTFVADDLVELPDLTGQIVDSRYTLAKIIRDSRKAPLYQASDNRLGRSVALKFLSPGFARYPGYLQQFNREADAAAHLRHPHVCKVLDHGQARLRTSGGDKASVYYICFELMEGGSLADRLAPGGAAPDLLTLTTWLDDLTDALEYSHRAGLIHGGLKPSAVVFDTDDTVYLTDFATSTSPGAGEYRVWHGSADFLAPEQWEGNPPAAEADQYSLAATIFLAITGKHVFDRQQDPEARKLNFERGAPPAHEVALRNGVQNVPPGVSDVLRRALSIAPADRYASIRDFYLAFRYAATNPPASKPSQPRVFISYRRDTSSGWAMVLAKELSGKYGIHVFLDTQRVDTAIRVSAKVEAAIRTSDVFVCLLARTTLRSAWVQEEIRLAWKDSKPMIPVFQQSFRFPTVVENLPAWVQDLLRFEAVPLLDKLNVHVDHTIADLAGIIKTTHRREDDNYRQADGSGNGTSPSR